MTEVGTGFLRLERSGLTVRFGKGEPRGVIRDVVVDSVLCSCLGGEWGEVLFQSFSLNTLVSKEV